MAAPSLSDELRKQALGALKACDGNQSAAARMLGLNRKTFIHRLRIARDVAGFEYPEIPAQLVPVEELIDRRKQQYAVLAAHEEATKLVPVKVTADGPIGILHFGDPHLDDDGTNIGLIEHHVKLVHDTPGLFAANVGDTTNNWTGRLGHLYAQQSTSAAEAWQLAEWFIGSVSWLYLIAGNHNLWSGAGDPLRWIKDQGGAPYSPSEARLELCFPNGHKVRINARHDFAGSSQWNQAHGPLKALLLGLRDHLGVCGHKHISGLAVTKDPASGIIMQALQIASYKIYDHYAKERGFRDQNLSPCALTVIDPALRPDHPDLIKVFWDADEGVDYLNFKRRKC